MSKVKATYINVTPPVVTPPPTVRLELTLAQAAVLREIMGSIGGAPGFVRKGVTDQIWDALKDTTLIKHVRVQGSSSLYEYVEKVAKESDMKVENDLTISSLYFK